MTFLDIILFCFLVWGVINGLRKGLFVELASLVSLLLGIYVAIKFSGAVGHYLDGSLPEDPKTAAITAFIITFIAVVVGITLLAKVLTKIADFSGLGLMNRILGAFFGLLRMILVVSVVLTLFVKINFNNTFASQETLDKSMFFNPILKVSNMIFPTLKEWFVNNSVQ
ncbi:CvpA family protein [Flavobacterium sp. AG291]|uniref:CvpA family protein n=1 Tax=Flavobacterium sp. AG291 TaxID=2184000 RepID=UPI000E0C7B58|nr:CvpA family protein [Flavobacterium sp. AG291]RDI11985.1 membrane protein required for colicin V production [Flavobacterium sp. AG291]